MLKASEILNRAGILLHDTGFVRWSLPELLDWTHEGVSQILLAKPSAKSQSRIVHLAKGTKQFINAVAGTPEPLAFINVTRNISLNEPNDVRGGRIITLVKQSSLDVADPNWHNDDYNYPTQSVKHVVYHEENPLEFFVYPPNDGSGMIEIIISTMPAKVAPTGDVTILASYHGDIGLPALYSGALVDYVCYRAQSKDDLVGNGSRALMHFQQFAQAIGMKIQVEGATSLGAKRLANAGH